MAPIPFLCGVVGLVMLIAYAWFNDNDPDCPA
jgi:hypothetical protein